MRCSAIRREKGSISRLRAFAETALRSCSAQQLCIVFCTRAAAAYAVPGFPFCTPPAAPRRVQICSRFACTKEKNSHPPRRTAVGVGQLCFGRQERQRKKRRHVSSRCAEQDCTRLRFVGGDTKGVSPLGHLWRLSVQAESHPLRRAEHPFFRHRRRLESSVKIHRVIITPFLFQHKG